MKGKLRNAVVRIKSTEYSINKTNTDVLTLLVTVASSSYYVYKTTFLIKAKVGDKVNSRAANDSVVNRNRYVCMCDQNKKQVFL